MKALLVLLAASLVQDSKRLPPDWTPPFQDVRVEVVRASRDPIIDVVADELSVFEILQRIAVETGRELQLDPEAGDVHSPVRVDLRNRSLSEVVQSIAGSAGLHAQVDERRLILLPADEFRLEPRALLDRALSEYQRALIRHPASSQAGELRFAIADLQFRMGDFTEAAQEYSQLRVLNPDFPEMPALLYRMGHAFARAGNPQRAIETWLLLGEEYEGHDLAAAALTDVAAAFLELGDQKQASLAVRKLVEFSKLPLSADVMAQAGWLLLDCGNPERAQKVFERALESESASAQEIARAGMAALELRAGDSLKIVTAIVDYLEKHPRGRYAAPLTFELARSHFDLDQHGTALLCLRHVPELSNDPALAEQCTLLEGQLWQDCGLAERAMTLFESLTRSRTQHIARTALEAAADTALDDGQLQRASSSYEELERRFPEFASPALIGQAEVALRRRNRQRARDLVERALPITQETGQRARLFELARELAIPASIGEETEEKRP